MLSRRQIQFIKSLQQKKFRAEHNCFVAEGSKLVEELLQNQLPLKELYATSNWAENHKELLKSFSGLVNILTPAEFERISALKTPGNVLAVFRVQNFRFDPNTVQNEFILMLDGISDPGNLGTIIRTADWFGIKHVICSPETVDLYNPKTVQATMGSIARVLVHYNDLATLLEKLPASVPVFGAMLDGKPLTGLTAVKNGIILIGNESHGISKTLLHFVSDPVVIPSVVPDGAGTKRPESLNAAVASAILCYELSKSHLKCK